MHSAKVIGILTKNEAFASILSMVLRDCPGSRVRSFDSNSLLQSYLRLAPIHLLICDLEMSDGTTVSTLGAIKSDPKTLTENMQTIALTKCIDRRMQDAVGIVGIDEVIIKPMSPAYIRERVDARMVEPAKYRRIPNPKRTTKRPLASIVDRLSNSGLEANSSGNVVSLFGNETNSFPTGSF